MTKSWYPRLQAHRYAWILTCLVLWCFTPGCATTLRPPTAEIELDGPDGNRVWKLEPDQDEVELENADSETIVEYEYEGGEIQFEDQSGRRLVCRPGTDGSIRIQDARGATLYTLDREPDGDLELEDATGAELYKVKLRDYGYKVVDREDREQKVRAKNGKVSLRDYNGNTVLSTRDTTASLAVACFAFEELPLAVRGAFSLGVLAWLPPGTGP